MKRRKLEKYYTPRPVALVLTKVGNKKVKDKQASLRELPVGEIDADFTIVSHGKRAGTVIDFDPAQKANVHMFIKVKQGKDVNEVRRRLENLDLSKYLSLSTLSYAPSIAPSELVEVYKNQWTINN